MQRETIPLIKTRRQSELSYPAPGYCFYRIAGYVYPRRDEMTPVFSPYQRMRPI
jgi:hypothetical protein